jgi:branched-chain amino acid transport system permease protein
METTKPKKKFDLKRTGVIALVIYIVFLIGPIAGLDFPAIYTAIKANPLQLVQFLIIGISNGAIIAIIALGYTMVYGIIELINFAHGDVYMIGVFTSLTVLSLTGTLESKNPGTIVLGLILALVIAIVVCAVLNAAIERLAYRRLRNAPRLAPLISAIGMSFIIENIGLMWAAQSWLVPSFGTTGGASQKVFPDMLGALFKASGINDGDVNILSSTGWALRLTVKDILVIVLASVLMVGLRLFVQRTQLGKAMRATAQNRDAAKMLGDLFDRWWLGRRSWLNGRLVQQYSLVVHGLPGRFTIVYCRSLGWHREYYRRHAGRFPHRSAGILQRRLPECPLDQRLGICDSCSYPPVPPHRSTWGTDRAKGVGGCSHETRYHLRHYRRLPDFPLRWLVGSCAG